MANLLTVVTVVRNDNKGLKNTLNNLKTQDTNEYNWAILDAGGSLEYKYLLSNIFNDLRSFGVNVNYRTSQDKGIYDAMNKGARLAKTPYVIFINAGDTLARTDSLRHLIDAIKQSNDADYVCGAYTYVDLDGHEKPTYIEQDPKIGWQMVEAGAISPRFMKGIPLHNSMAIKRSVLLDCPYNWKEYPVSGDTEQMIRAWKMGWRKWEVAPVLVCKFFAGGTCYKNRITVLEELTRAYMKSSFRPQMIYNSFKASVPYELHTQSTIGFHNKKRLWSFFKLFPIQTAKFFLDMWFNKPVDPTTITVNNIINLSQNLDTFRSLSTKGKIDLTVKLIVSSPMAVNATKATIDTPIANLFEYSKQLKGNTVIVCDSVEQFDSEIRYHLKRLGIKRCYYFMEEKLRKGRI